MQIVPVDASYHSPSASMSGDALTPSILQRSMKWDWAAARSGLATPIHLAANSDGVMTVSMAAALPQVLAPAVTIATSWRQRRRAS